MARGYKDYRQVVAAEEPEGKFSVHGTTRMYDDFEDTPLKWHQELGSRGSTIRTPDAAYNGSFGMKICTQKEAAADRFNWMYRFPPSGERRTGELAIYWKSPEHSDISEFIFGLGETTPATDYAAQIRYVNDVPGGVHEWQLLVPGGYTTLATSEEIELPNWHEIVLACDFASGRYLYARADRLVFPICSTPIWSSGLGSTTFNYCFIGLYDRDGALTCMYVDDVLLKEL